MKKQPLLPNHFKKIGWFLLVPSFILGLIILISGLEISVLNSTVLSIFPSKLSGQDHFFGWIETNLTNTLVGALFLLGSLFVGFSKEKVEDEFIASMRLSALLWAVLVNYAVLFLAFIFVYNFAFLEVMIYNMFTVLILFIVRFHFLIYRSNKLVTHEE